MSSLKIIGLLHFLKFLGPSEKNYNLQYLMITLQNKIIIKIECCGAKFYHEHDLRRLDQAQSQQETTKKLISIHKGCRLLVFEPVHCGSNSILKVRFLGHPVHVTCRPLEHTACSKSKDGQMFCIFILLAYFSNIPQPKI